MLRVTIWNEFLHEQRDADIRRLYPKGIHGALSDVVHAQIPDAHVNTATLEEPEHGLTQAVVEATDVMLWWGHLAHERVESAVVDRVHNAVLQGMGLIVLHSAHLSRIFRRLMGTTCNLRWREADDRELLWTVAPAHPIAEAVPQPVVIPAHEMYGEYFDVPPPDELVFISAFTGGEVFRSGLCYTRGKGRVFYFSPGHETYPVYQNPSVARIIGNAVRWAAPVHRSPIVTTMSPNAPPGWYEQEPTD